MSLPNSPHKSRLAVWFLALSLSLLGIATIVAEVGIVLSKTRLEASHRIMPIPFWISTALLAVGSATLQRAAWHVRLQRLPLFRKLLLWSLVIGTLFVGVQSAGLWQLVRNQDPIAAATGANAFLVMVAGLHGIHFVIALLFVAWITVNAFANRYDHEYSWSVTFCACFWHTLGIVWLAVLTLFAAGAVTGLEGISTPDPQTELVQILTTSSDQLISHESCEKPS